MGHRVRGRHECIARDQDLVPGTDSCCRERGDEGVGAARDQESVGRAESVGKLPFEEVALPWAVGLVTEKALALEDAPYGLEFSIVCKVHRVFPWLRGRKSG
jgi:hypothetical protein